MAPKSSEGWERMELRRKCRPLGGVLYGVMLAGVFLVTTPSFATQAAAAKPQGKRTPLELLQTAHTLFLQKDYEAAREYYLEVLPSYPKNFDVLKNLAYCYYRRGSRGYAQAASYYTKALAIQPDSVEVSENLARCLAGLNRHGEAGEIYERMATQPDAAAINWKRAAEAYAEAHRNRQAEAAFDAYLQRSPGDLDARTRWGDLYTSEKNYARAQEQYRLVLTANPNYPRALIGLGRLASWQGRHDEALKYFDRALRLSPRNGDALTAKAFALLWLERFEESRTLFQDLQKRYPRSSEIARGLEQADAALRQKELVAARRAGDTAAIEAYYRDRLERNPNDVSALRALADASATPELCADSIDMSRKGLELSPGDLGLELRLARSLALCQQYEEAVGHYRRILEGDPKSGAVLTELGSSLLRARRGAEAIEPFRRALQINPQNTDAKLGLALALAANREYDEALALHEEILKTSPDNYDALQGKAFVLSWTGHYAESRAIFQSLASRKPDDAQNTDALNRIAAAEEEKKWQTLRPESGAAPEAWIAFYDQRLAAYPGEISSLKGRAYQLSKLDDNAATIDAYRQVLAASYDDTSAKRELARFLARERQYDEAIKLYQEALTAEPDDFDTLEALSRVQSWAGRDDDSLAGYQKLLAAHPSNTSYGMEVARLQLKLNETASARQSLNKVIAADPQNRDAHIELARLDTRAGDRASALTHYEAVLKQNPHDSTALLGQAQIAYYQGDFKQAHAAASEVVAAEPNSFDAVFLLASIEHARHHRRQSLNLLDQASAISPNNSEVTAMRQRIRDESAVTLQTVASYAREIGPPSRFDPTSALPHEDLRTFAYGGTLGFSFLPRTDSYFSVTALPSSSPMGPTGTTGITGAVAPQQFLYRQRTRIGESWSFRGGAGLVRFGPGEIVRLPGSPNDFAASATTSPLGLVGTTYQPNQHFSLDIGVDYMPINYTPTSVKYGVMRSRFSGGLRFYFDARTDLAIDYDFAHYRSKAISGPEYRDNAHFGEIDFNRVVATSDSMSFDLGIESVWYGFGGRDRGVYMGFFNPRLYQRYLLTPRIYGRLYGPVSYELRGGIGTQKSDRDNPWKLGGRVSPALSFKVNDHFSFGIGYTYYNTSQAFGTLRGNSVRVTTDWKF